MTTYLIAGIVVLFLTGLLVFMNEKYGLLSSDRFPTPYHRWLAYVWFGLFMLVITVTTAFATQNPTRAEDLKNVPFYSLFGTHVLLAVFLFIWWALSGRPSFRSYMNLPRARSATPTFIGIGVGVGGWALTIGTAIAIGTALLALDLIKQDMKPSPMIPWMAALPFWQRALIVLSAMTVEEAFFRGWLQKRVGLVISTIVFALAHAGYAQPMLLIGVTIISIVIGYTFYRTRNLWPCIVAHGVFDAIQLFVVVPFAVRMMGT